MGIVVPSTVNILLQCIFLCQQFREANYSSLARVDRTHMSSKQLKVFVQIFMRQRISCSFFCRVAKTTDHSQSMDRISRWYARLLSASARTNRTAACLFLQCTDIMYAMVVVLCRMCL